MERLPSISEPPDCPICNEYYDADKEDLIPRNLTCGHSMCSRCIAKYIFTSGKEEGRDIIMTCPSKCTMQTVIEDGNILNLPKNFAVIEIIHSRQFERSQSRGTLLSSCSEYTSNCDVCENSKAEVACPSCAVSLCLSCSNDIHSKKGYQVHRLVSMLDVLNGTVEILPSDGLVSQRSNADIETNPDHKMCKIHSSELVEYMCVTCSEEVCKRCHLVDSHRGHDCRLLKDVAHEKRDTLRLLLTNMQEKHAIWNKGFDRCQELREYASSRHTELEDAVRSHFEEIRSQLQNREEKVLKDLQEEMLSRDQLLSSQADHLAKVCTMAKDLCEECEDMIGGSNSQVACHAEILVAKVQQLVRSEQDTNPVVSDSIQAEFEDKGKLLQLVDHLGELKFPPGRVECVRVKRRGPSEVLVTWQALSSPSITSYLVEVSSAGHPYRVVYEGANCEYVADEFVVEEDILYYFRVAAVNDVGIGPYSISVSYTKRKASFLWDPNLRHPRTHISNGGYTVSIGENATWVSVGANTVLSHGSHYWEVVLEKYGSPSMSRKAVIGVVDASFHQWHRSHGVIGIKTCPIGNRSWGLACGTAKKLSHGSTFLNSLGRKHNLFHEGDAVGVMLDLSDHVMSFYRNGKPLGIIFTDVYGPVIPAVSFCRHKTLTLRFPSSPPTSPVPARQVDTSQVRARSRSTTALLMKEKIAKTNTFENTL